MFGDDEEDTAGAVQQGVTNEGSDYVFDESSGYGFRLSFLPLYFSVDQSAFGLR